MSSDITQASGFFGPERGLERPVQDQGRLDDTRQRRSASLSPDASRESNSPSSPEGSSTSEHLAREQLKLKLMREHGASLPTVQFDVQVSEERDRLLKESSKAPGKRMHTSRDFQQASEQAEENVKQLWIEQEIWNPVWCLNGGNRPGSHAVWKHEESFMFRSKLFGFTQGSHWAQPGTNGRILCGKGRDASRPISQFVYQMFKESAKEQLNTGILIYRPHTNSEAYHKVKSRWIEWGIWDEEWEILPGMSWKHEHPLEDPFREGLGDEKPLLPRAISTGARSLTPTGRLSARSVVGTTPQGGSGLFGSSPQGGGLSRGPAVRGDSPGKGDAPLGKTQSLFARRPSTQGFDSPRPDKTSQEPGKTPPGPGPFSATTTAMEGTGTIPIPPGIRTPRAIVWRLRVPAPCPRSAFPGQCCHPK